MLKARCPVRFFSRKPELARSTDRTEVRMAWQTRSLEERFWAKVDLSYPDDCWIWFGCRRNGYGQIKAGGKNGGKTLDAHRVSYEMAYGPIPKGFEIHHTCQNKSCVNPDHLELCENRLEHTVKHLKLLGFD